MATQLELKKVRKIVLKLFQSSKTLEKLNNQLRITITRNDIINIENYLCEKCPKYRP